MRKLIKESAAPEQKGADRENSGNGWLKSHWCVLALCVTIVVAFALRTVFAYGISVDGDFALSGGSSAQYHLHVIESILNGSYSMTDSAVNYPDGGLSVYPPLMDFIGAAIASILTATGMGTTEAASAALAVLNPLIGALTCIPVFLLGKEMFDKRVGVVAAVVFAFLALPISTTVFSSGTPYGLAAFLLAFMSLFVLRMVKAADAEDASKKGIFLNAILAGIFLLLSALTWNGFRFVVVLLVVAMVLQIVADRFRGRDFTNVLFGYAITILVGTLVSAAYYIPAGLWDAVYSGPCLIAVLAVVLSFVFMALRKMPWVITVPALTVVFIAVCAVLALVAPDLYNDLVWGNSIYTSSIMEELVSSHVSMSNVSSYYGWLTMWLPICYALYSTYVYLRKDHSATRLFITVWMFVMFFAVWTTSANAAVVGSVFAVGSAVVIVRVFEAANLKDWWASMKSAGFPGLFRKMIKPLPFLSVVITAFLIVAPNVSFAVDAGISNNSDADYYFSGNTQYTIKTGDSYPIGGVWDDFSDKDKSGALATWMDYSYDAVNLGGFDSVTDTLGGGSSAVAQMLLAKGSGGATAAAMIRLMLANGSTDFSSAFAGHADVYSTIAGYIDDPEKAVDAIDADPDTYGKIRSDITDENAVYFASIEAMTSEMNEIEIMDAYNSVRQISGDSITYFLMDGSMLPLQYGDKGYFSTIAYFADYSVDNYGAATQFYSYNTYYGYTNYTSAIYETFLWKAMIGPSATQAGYSNSYSYLVDLASSDGTVKAMPGYGLAGYDVAFWQVMYNPEDGATVSDDGWEYMDAREAIELQKDQGGMINYLSSIVMLEYTGVSGDSIDGQVVSAGQAADGVTVSVYQYDETFGQYALYSQTRSIDGQYSVLVPAGDYRVEFSIGDAEIASYRSGSVPQTIDVPTTSAEGAVKVGDVIYSAENMRLQLTGQATLGDSENVIDVMITDGTFGINNILPGTYTYVLYSENGTSLGTGSVTFAAADNQGVVVSPKTQTITVTVNDYYGNSATEGRVFAVNTGNGAQFSADVEDGKAVITVISGQYNLFMGQGAVSMYSSTVNVSSSNRTATIVAYDAQSVTIQNAPSGVIFTVTAGTFSTMSYNADGTVMFDVPKSIATDRQLYTVYGFGNGNVYHAAYTGGSSVSVSTDSASTVTGKLLDGDSGEEGTITFVSGNNEYYSFSTDSEGVYTALLPRGAYTVTADNGSNKVYVGSYTVGNDDEEDFNLVDGRRIGYTLKYDRGTSGSDSSLPFVLGVVKYTYESRDYTFYSMTNTSGVVNFYVPDDLETVISLNTVDGTLDNDAFMCTKLTRTVSAGSSNNSNTLTISVYDAEKVPDNYVKPMDVAIPYDMELEYYEDDSDVEPAKYSAGTTQSLRPGQYTVTIDGSTGHYYKGTAYIYPGETQFYDLDVQSVAVVTIDKAEADRVTIETEDGSYHSFSNGYYFETGYKYYLKSVNGSGDDRSVQYGYLDLTSASAGSEFDVNMTASSKVMEITGNVGVVADGTITVSYQSVEVVFDVKDGAYTLELPSNVSSASVSVDVSATIDNEECYFSANGTLTDLRDGVIRNISVISTDAPADEDEEEPGFVAEVINEVFADGEGTFGITIQNKTDSVMTYRVTAGSALNLEQDANITIGAGQTGTVQVSVYYDANRVAPGSDGFSVTVADINGTDSQVIELTEGASVSGSSDIKVYTMGQEGSEFNDRVSAYQYMYALTFVNDNAFSHTVRINATGVPNGWYASVVDESGAKVADLGTEFTIYGLQTTALYVKLMLLSADKDVSASVPSINVSVSIDGSNQNFNLDAQGASVTTDSMSTSGSNVFDERSGIPSGVWFLVAVIILLIVAVFWLASKRGVFSR